MGIYDSHRKRITSGNCSTVGQILKHDSNLIMEQTWDSDIQSKCCFIYDYFHDDQPALNKHMTYENTTKTKIDAKFIVSSYGSIDKDQVAYHLMFRPSQKLEFEENDELYYFETDYRNKYDVTFPIGQYCDIPDEKGVYTKWLICDYEEGNQFIKYVILPCDYRFQWISIENGKKIKRQMWGCTRSMNSYTAGTWIDRFVNSLDDVGKILLPLNNITQSFGYLKENDENQRVILSAKVDKPLTWKITKIENTKPIGLIKATLDQDNFNPHTDYIEKDENDNIIGMWADYYSSGSEPTNPDEESQEVPQVINCTLSSSSNSIRNNRFVTITSSYFNQDGENISDVYTMNNKSYYFAINEEDVSEYVSYEVQDDNKNIVKIKFSNDDYKGSLLTVGVSTSGIVSEIQLEIV